MPLQEPTKADLLQYEASKMQIEAPQRLSTAIIQLPTGDSVVEAMVDLQVEPPAVISWDQVRPHAEQYTTVVKSCAMNISPFRKLDAIPAALDILLHKAFESQALDSAICAELAV